MANNAAEDVYKWQFQNLLREIMTLKGETHLNFVLLHDHFTWSNEKTSGIVTIIDLCAGDLSVFLNRHPAIATLEKRKEWLKDLFVGLKYLHDVRGILHMDIKAQNLLVSCEVERRLKIADLGLCREMVEDGKGGMHLAIDCSDDFCWTGTLINQPPEYLTALLTNKIDFTTDYSFDTWAAGLVAYALFVDGKHPFTPDRVALKDPATLADSILSRIKQRLTEWTRAIDSASPEMEFVLFVLGIDKDGCKPKRPPAHECLKHEFLND
eukprot:Gregarina_sp_Pseudo_9__3838@NODE_398_length_2924_cov_29_748007_g375_i0_p1_GENE_NODE_398_length_2924_cov_29_748007_g375_i0NODE_398_length_2924_cov_29_748007_g375_i0_p1_ORF_typecomplete_len267_score40_50Pkinase/PF00069_25/6_2e25Pkinase_Tyr/PF07714_17/3_1e19Pkinase_fungal/PF17667_1/1_3e05Kinaselike/PF14531_6/0_00011Kdo/PF06293_14/0_00025Kdo/PF06293_14/7_5e03WaaY/PF06176_11/0_28_NODE_398_length_2924_cov_29_748007_g375_i015732373